MKLPRIALLVLALVGTTNAHAFWVRAQVYVNPAQVTAAVENIYGTPLVCRVHVAGQRSDGLVEYGWSQVVIAPGMFEYATAYTSYPFYFVNAQGSAECFF